VGLRGNQGRETERSRAPCDNQSSYSDPASVRGGQWVITQEIFVGRLVPPHLSTSFPASEAERRSLHLPPKRRGNTYYLVFSLYH
jgi:hypothetical protein